MKGLILDDTRSIEEVLAILGARKPDVTEWTLVSNSSQFRDVIMTELPAFVTFDHDLGELDPDGMEVKGYHVALWLVGHCHDNDLPLPRYDVHSANGPGALNIASLLESALKVGYVKPLLHASCPQESQP